MVKEASQKQPGPDQPPEHPELLLGWVGAGWLSDGPGTPRGTARTGTTEQTSADSQRRLRASRLPGDGNANINQSVWLLSSLPLESRAGRSVAY